MLRAHQLRWLDNLFGLFYPNLCLACGRNLPPKQEGICVTCRYKLPKTNFQQEAENAFTERFWGRVALQAGAAFLHFTKGGRTQRLIHHLKYEGKKEIGIYLGKLYGQALREAPVFREATLIVPVPLHPRKERQRGYNQSDLFARGLSEAMGIPWLKNGLKRSEHTATQTKKSRLERFDNVEKAFAVPRPEKIEKQHVLLVDDVITTGATLEACALKILEVPGTKVSMATIAIAG